MRKGKIDLKDLDQIIQSYKGATHRETLLRPSVGEDSCIIDLRLLDEDVMFISSDPITITSESIGKLAVIINSNDIYASGGRCYGVILNILLPTNRSIKDFENVMRDIHLECLNHNLEILGGHTEVTEVVNDIVVCLTIIGVSKRNEIVKTSSSNIEDLIFLTKPLGVEGTIILFDKFKRHMKNILSQEEINEVEKFRNKISIKRESEILKDFKVNSMHDITEGGLIGALFEMSISSNQGFKIFENKINVNRVTRKICNYLNRDVYHLISSGNLLFTVSPEYKDNIKEAFLSEDIECSLIGEIAEKGKYIFSKGNDEQILFNIKDSIFD